MLVDIGETDISDGPNNAGAVLVPVQFRDLSSALIETMAPALVIGPLFGLQHDALDIAEQLSKIGYRGRYCAVSKPLKSAETVRREISERCKKLGLEFDLLSMPASSEPDE